MRCVYGSSTEIDIKKAATEATKDIVNPKVIFYFSNEEHFAEYSLLIAGFYPDAIVRGATSYMCISGNGYAKYGLSVVSIEDGVDAVAGVIPEVSDDPLKYSNQVIEKYNQLGKKDNNICIEFTNGLLAAEEKVVMALNSVLLYEGVQVFGGSAGSADLEHQTRVSYNGIVYDNACVYCILHNESGPIHIYKENIYQPITGHKYQVTKADSARRLVYEMDDRAALDIFQEELNITSDQVEVALQKYPWGKDIGDDGVFVIANEKSTTDRGISFFARVHGGTHMMVLESGDYKSITKATLEKIKSEVPNPSFILVCHCEGRLKEFEGYNFVKEYSDLQCDMFGQFIGFSGYGEQVGTRHFNHMQTFAVFE